MDRQPLKAVEEERIPGEKLGIDPLTWLFVLGSARLTTKFYHAYRTHVRSPRHPRLGSCHLLGRLRLVDLTVRSRQPPLRSLTRRSDNAGARGSPSTPSVNRTAAPTADLVVAGDLDQAQRREILNPGPSRRRVNSALSGLIRRAPRTKPNKSGRVERGSVYGTWRWTGGDAGWTRDGGRWGWGRWGAAPSRVWIAGADSSTGQKSRARGNSVVVLGSRQCVTMAATAAPRCPSDGGGMMAGDRWWGPPPVAGPGARPERHIGAP